MITPISINYPESRILKSYIANKHVLKLIDYTDQLFQPISTYTHFGINLPQLAKVPRSEVWLSHDPVSYDEYRGIQLAQNGEVLCGHMIIKESDDSNLEELVFTAYKKIYTLLQDSAYRYLLRVWNYFPKIHQNVDSLERYQSFCVGRANAIADAKQENSLFPAASVIGSHSGPLVIYFIAAKEPGIQVENPQQISAFHYPDIYSPKSPSFSRAMIKHWEASSHLFISGTASILGHKTTHIDDAKAQFEQTVSNLRALTDKSNTNDKISEQLSFSDVLWKVYIREPENFPLVEKMLNRELKPSHPVLYLQGDICRSGLLLEIEGVY